MLAQILSLMGQSLFFILGVYIEKMIRNKVVEKRYRKKIKNTSRIVVCSIMTFILLFFNYTNECSPQTSFSSCFFLDINMMHIVHVLIANSILFGMHIYEKFIKGDVDFKKYTIKSILIAPILEELLFRAAFYRVAAQIVPIFIIALMFSVSHVHKSLIKVIKGKSANWKSTKNQIIFTFIFGLYSFYFLKSFNSVIPSIILHCYCNILGPPNITKNNLKHHAACIMGIFFYCFILI